MKITKLIIQNFQSHEDTVLEFGPHVNCILGPSDSGKSSVVRSLVSLLFKEKFYIRNGCSFARITGEFSDGTVVTREKKIKDKQVSEKFILNGVTYRKIGKTLPEEFIKAFKMHEIILNDGSKLNLNVQGQHDGKFLLSNSEYSQSFRARVTSMAGSETLDRASQEAAKDHRRVKSDLTRATDVELPELDKQIHVLDGLNERLQDLKTLKEQAVSLDVSIKNFNMVSSLIAEHKRISSMKYIDHSLLVNKLKKLLANLQLCLLLRKLRTNLKFDHGLTVDTTVFTDSISNIIILNNTLSQIKALKSVIMERTSLSNIVNNKKYSEKLMMIEYDKFMESLTRCPLCLK